MAGRDVNVVIRAINRVTRPLQQMGESVQKFSAKSKAHMKAARISANQMGRNVRSAGAGFAVLAGGVVAAVAAVDKFTAMGDNAAKTADKLGVGIEQLQEWRYAAQRSGMSNQEFDNSLQYLVRSAGEAAAGVGSAKDVFKGLGIDVKDANGNLKSGGQLMDEVADALSKVENGTAKTTLTYKLFGRSGVGMVNMLKDGSKGLKDYAKEARDSGAVVDKETARQSEKFQDLFLNLTRFGKGIFVSVFSKLLPSINNITKSVLGWVKGNKDLIASKLSRFIAGAAHVAIGFYKGLRGIYDGINAVWEVVKSFLPSQDKMNASMETWQIVGKALAGMLGGYLVFALISATKAVIAFGAALWANPITWVVAAVAALATAAYLIYENWEPIAAWFKDLWAGITATVKEFFTPLVNLWATGADAITAAWDGLVSWFKDLWGRVLGAFDAGGFTSAAFELLTGFLDGLVSGAVAVIAWAWDLPRQILKALLPEDWYNAGSSMLDKVLGGLVSGAGKIVSWAGGLVSRMLKALLPTSWYEAGSKLVASLADGLKNAAKSLLGGGIFSSIASLFGGGGDGQDGSAQAMSPAAQALGIAPAYGPRGGQGGRMSGLIKVQLENAPPGSRITSVQNDTDQDMDISAGMTTSPGFL
jgi:hypothetical protein